MRQSYLLSARYPETEVVTVPLTHTSQDGVPEAFIMAFATHGSVCHICICAEEICRLHWCLFDHGPDRLFSTLSPTLKQFRVRESQVSVIRQLKRLSHWGPDSKETALGLTGQESQDFNGVNSLCSSHQKSPLWSCLISIQPLC